MRGLIIHATVYVVVNAVLVFIWIMGGGSIDELRRYTEEPLDALTPSFWPIYAMVIWGAALVIHAVIVVTGLFGARGRRRRDRVRERQAHDRAHTARRRAVDPLTGVGDAADTKVPGPAWAPGPSWLRPNPDGAPAEGTGRDEPVRRFVTVMFTDIADSTPLTETLGDGAWAQTLAEHRIMVRGCVEQCEGTEVGTQGDGFLVRFGVPDHAVRCATELQRTLDDKRQSGAFTPHLRIGIHTGETIENDEDLVGRVVNLASRVVTEAEPDEILITEQVADQLHQRAALVDRGLRPLKGVAQPRHLLAVDWQESPHRL